MDLAKKNRESANDSDNSFEDAIERLRHLLPVQGPIDTFIHHNTLHSFEHLEFEEAVESASKIYHAHPYLTEDLYRKYYREGRITHQDIESELMRYLGRDRTIVSDATRYALRRELVFRGLSHDDETISRWRLREGSLTLRSDLDSNVRRKLIEDTHLWLVGLRSLNRDSFASRLQAFGLTSSEIHRFTLERTGVSPKERNELDSKMVATFLWHLCTRAISRLAPMKQPILSHHRDVLRVLSGVDIFDIINPTLIQLCSRFTDQAVSLWPMPGKENELLAAAEAIFTLDGVPRERWLRNVSQLFRELQPTKRGTEETLTRALSILGVPEEARGKYVIQSGLALKGWAGLIALFEAKPHLADERPVNANLYDFLAVQAILCVAAVQDIVHRENLPSLALPELQRICASSRTDRFTFARGRARIQVLFEVCQLVGITPRQLADNGKEIAEEIGKELEEFPEVIRQRIWHLAYEKSFTASVVGAFRSHPLQNREPANPAAQLLFCIDEREESIRRHLEEIQPEYVTHGYPGFYSLPIAFQGVHHLHAEALCPVVLNPTIFVREIDKDETRERGGNLIQRFVGFLGREVHRVSRSSLGGSFFAATIGHFAFVPFVLRVLAPALAGRMHEIFHHPTVENPRFDVTGAMGTEGVRETIVDALARVFQTIGIADKFAPIVAIVGHGSSSLNNPHESAHDCGACGGHRGMANARLFTRFANDPEIRKELEKKNVYLPVATHVVGVYHDTCDDTVTVFDDDMVPEHLRGSVDDMLVALKEAAARNAAERARRFLTSPKGMSPDAAVVSMRHRAEDFAEPRPEYGHATNAFAFVGRRERTRGLFLDRRSFLSCYDATKDNGGALLEGLLRAVIPVCAGINLEYYFSFVDSAQYGCGTKLPHNIVGGIGVMDGAESDLRTGLPWQMVEIHEPVRLTAVVEVLPETLLAILNRNPGIRALVERRWLWLLAAHPQKHQYWIYENGEFKDYHINARKLPRASDSLSYCTFDSRHLPFAVIEPLKKMNSGVTSR